MSWFSDLAGKAEHLLTNLDEQTGAAFRNHNRPRVKSSHNDFTVKVVSETTGAGIKRPPPRMLKKTGYGTESRIPRNISPVRNIPTSRNSSEKSVFKNSQNLVNRPKSLSNREKQETDNYTWEKRSIGTESRISRNMSPVRNIPSSRNSEKSVYKYNQNLVNKSPKSLSNREKHETENFTWEKRRFSSPEEIKHLITDETWIHKLENLEVENEMLKTELNLTHSEIKELLRKLKLTYDDGTVIKKKLEETEELNDRTIKEKENILSQMQELKQKIHDVVELEVATYKSKSENFQEELQSLKKKNDELDEKCKTLQTKLEEKDAIYTKIESELKHTKCTVAEMQCNLEESNAECRRLEADWEAYKLRVKNMLNAKDNEIRMLQDEPSHDGDKDLLEQIEVLKNEKQMLSETITSVRNQCEETNARLLRTESRNTAAERVVSVLRDALRDERVNRNKTEAQWLITAKELKALQMDTNQKIIRMESIINEKDQEIIRLREEKDHTSNTSTLNVAEYGVQFSIDDKKIQCLTETLVQRQTKIDKLVAQNNVLRIQLQKLETKYNAELLASRTNKNQSVVHLQDSDTRYRSRLAASTLSALSVRMGVMGKRYPFMRVLVIIYMICLHLWVLTVLFTSTPEDYVTKPSNKS